MSNQETEQKPNKISWAGLCLACVLVAGLTAYPPMMVGPSGKPDHGVLLLLMWAMSAGLISGVGFVPRIRIFRWAFSIYAAYAAFAAALVLMFLRG